MNSAARLILVLALTLLSTVVWHSANAADNFVMQLTRPSDNYGQKRALLQIDRVLDDLGEDKVHVTVVAYEDGIHALLANNVETAQLVSKLATRGVSFKACRISMKAWGLTEEQFPLEVEFVPAGATEVIRLQMQGYKYWRP